MKNTIIDNNYKLFKEEIETIEYSIKYGDEWNPHINLIKENEQLVIITNIDGIFGHVRKTFIFSDPEMIENLKNILSKYSNINIDDKIRDLLNDMKKID